MATVRERLHGPERHVEVEASPGLPPLWADRDVLVVVLLNPLDNAANTPAGTSESRYGRRAKTAA
jgi:hypothetical protein